MPLPQIVGSPRVFFQKARFIIEIDGVVSAAFQKCSELAVEADEVSHREGGSIIPDKTPGLLNFADITLERGATFDADLFNWFRTIAIAAAGIGLVTPAYKRTLTVVQQDRTGARVEAHTVFGAWVKRFSTGEWDNTVSEARIESVTLAFDFFDRTL